MIDSDHLTPEQRIEVQDFYARRWLMLHTPVRREGTTSWRSLDRRACVRAIQFASRRHWPHAWAQNDADRWYVHVAETQRAAQASL